MSTAEKLVQQVCLFQGLAEEAINSIAQLCTARSLPKGTVICYEEDVADTLYLINKGEVKVYLSDDKGQELVLTFLGEGSYFGELGILSDQKRAASVITTKDSNLFFIRKTEFDQLLDDTPAITKALLTNLAQFSKDQVSTIKAFAMKDVYGRLVNLLETLAVTEDEKKIIRPKVTQKVLASRVGATRERVARIMKDLETGGYIAVGTRQIELVKKLPASY